MTTAVERASVIVVKVCGALGMGYRLSILACCTFLITAGIITATVLLADSFLVAVPVVATLPCLLCLLYYCSLEATLAAIIADRQQTGAGGGAVPVVVNALPV
jgi:hypothetical protein